jgi:signal transduction histidine kinase
LPAQVENHLFRIASEAVTNARKHALATRIDVEVQFEPDTVTLRVQDDGRGFDATQPLPPESGHFGLFGMRERVEKLRGELHIDSRPGAGTEIRVRVPLGETAPAESASASSTPQPV